MTQEEMTTEKEIHCATDGPWLLTRQWRQVGNTFFAPGLPNIWFCTVDNSLRVGGNPNWIIANPTNAQVECILQFRDAAINAERSRVYELLTQMWERGHPKGLRGWKEGVLDARDSIEAKHEPPYILAGHTEERLMQTKERD